MQREREKTHHFCCCLLHTHVCQDQKPVYLQTNITQCVKSWRRIFGTKNIKQVLISRAVTFKKDTEFLLQKHNAVQHIEYIYI